MSSEKKVSKLRSIAELRAFDCKLQDKLTHTVLFADLLLNDRHNILFSYA